MKKIDQYHKWVEWSEEDQTYIGKCPDLITGIHGDDLVKPYGELCEVIEDVIHQFEAEQRALPNPRIRPMQEVGSLGMPTPPLNWYTDTHSNLRVNHEVY